MASRDPQRPNIIVLLADDQGPWALGAAGNAEIQTPHLDRLAAEGTRFTSFFCTSPVCSPARASLLTGHIPSSHGVQDALHGTAYGPNAIDFLAGQPIYPGLLSEQGYTCGLVGKWHLGDYYARPDAYTYWNVIRNTGRPPYNDITMIRVDESGGREVFTPGYSTDIFTDAALDFLEKRQRDDQPFHLNVHYMAPHAPWVDTHPQEYVDLYRDCTFDSCPQRERHPWTRPSEHDWPALRQARAEPASSLAGYFAAVTAMDHGIGRVLDWLDRHDMRESTLICFLSDNGFCAGHHGVWGKGNGTFPQNMYDESVTVPAIFSQPGSVQSGVTSNALASGYDLRPTLLEHAGVPDSEAERLPGRSLAPILRGDPTAAGRDHVVVQGEYGPARMIRTHQWKYVHRYPYGPHELYHLAEDPGETTNLAHLPEHRDVRDDLHELLRGWFRTFTDPAVDGVYEANTGSGQIDRVGTGRQAFATAGGASPGF